jgi:hypothetical protein
MKASSLKSSLILSREDQQRYCSIAPNAFNVAFCASVKPFTPVMFMRYQTCATGICKI